MIESLIQFGLTRQEATIYLTLITDGELSGYEVAKLTGISRSNTYNGLAGLVEKGAAYLIEGNVTKYTAVAIDEFCSNKIRALSELRTTLIELIPNKRETMESYVTIKGEKHIMDKLKHVLETANQRVYMALSTELLQRVDQQVEDLIKRGIKLVVITETPLDRAEVISYVGNVSKNQIRVIVDSKSVLTGDLLENPLDDCTCLYSKNKNLVDVFKQMLHNEIQLLEIKNEKKGER